jgi:ligand-binding sensor domain-containing protein
VDRNANRRPEQANPKTNQVTKYVFNKNDPHSVSDNFITSIYEDSRNRLWIGTLRGGLNLFDKTTGVFTGSGTTPKTALLYRVIRFVEFLKIASAVYGLVPWAAGCH